MSSIRCGVLSYDNRFIPLTDEFLVQRTEPVEFESFIPKNSPSTGGTSLLVKGRNFLKPLVFNQGLLCQFGTFSVPADVKNNSYLECVTPKFSKSGPTPFTVVLEDSAWYLL